MLGQALQPHAQRSEAGSGPECGGAFVCDDWAAFYNDHGNGLAKRDGQGIDGASECLAGAYGVFGRSSCAVNGLGV